MSDGLGTASYAYNTLSQMTSETRAFNGVGSYTLAYEYGLTGQLTKVTNPWSVSVSYTLDRAGRLESITGANYAGVGTYLQNIGYRATGAVKAQQYGNGRQYTASYDNRMRLTRWDVAGVGGAEYQYSNFNENTGRVTFAKNTYDASLDHSFDYDHVGRVSASYTANDARAHTGQAGGSWTGGGDYAHTYSYDVWGNLTARNGWGGQSIIGGVSYTPQNRVQGVTYDAAGNPVSDGGSSYTYDATGQQATSAVANMEMSYDGDRLRGKKTENGQTTYYLRSSVLGGQVVAEITGAGWSRGYVYGAGGSLLAIQQENQVEWVHQDPVTKSQRLTNQSGSVTAAIEVGLFGDEFSRVTNNSSRQPHKYTTYERDANGADDAMHRRYNWWRSRFEQPDPYDGSYSLTDPQSFNRYAYVGNDPVNFVDPMGLFQVCVVRSSTTYIEFLDDEGNVESRSAGRTEIWWECTEVGGGGGGGGNSDAGGGGGSLRPDIRDRETFAVNSSLGACGAIASIGEYSTVNPSGTMWKGRNGQWNRMGWGGNQHTGGRSVAVSNASNFKLLGKATGFVGVGFNGYQGVQSYRQGDNAGAAKSGLDIGMGIVGIAGGFVGAVVSGGYFAADTIGWDNCRAFLSAPCDRECRRK